ncbi:hypothetical protein EVAR_29614_1 [Eumeta japonica]|uniref:Uncharacterized protein n=1 Tax=Eumeta variegata TaxID=151549 RepID=A0A4C1VWZ2_EUMVA|nr:hypothetical protein EVAR_29614_1 [Eumeta japonica]
MRLKWGARADVGMRVCCVTAVVAALAALAACAAAEPAPAPHVRRYPTQSLSRPRALHELFEGNAPPPPQSPRASWRKRAPHMPSELASQMMLRASRSSRPYDVPQIGKEIGMPEYSASQQQIQRPCDWDKNRFQDSMEQ